MSIGDIDSEYHPDFIGPRQVEEWWNREPWVCHHQCDLYRRFDRPGDRPPAVGDLIRTNYSTGMIRGYTIRRLSGDWVTGMHIVVGVTNGGDEAGHRGDCYLNGYRMVDGRCIGASQIPGTAGWVCDNDPEYYDGRDEILIEKRADEAALERDGFVQLELL